MRAEPETAPPPDRPLAGVPWLIADMVLVTAMTVLVKMQGATYPAVQMVFIRALIGLLAILPLIWRRRRDFLTMRQPLRNAGRVACNALALTMNFAAVTALPLALVNAIGFTRPVVSMVLAVAILGERIGRIRWIGGGIAFLGVLFLIAPEVRTLPPGALIFNVGLLAAFGSVFFGSMAAIQTRALRGESTTVMMVFYTLGLVVLTAGPAIWVWAPVRPGDWPALLAIGVLAQTAQYFFLRAYRGTEAGMLAPFGYLSILLAGAAGWVFFDERPHPEMLIGAAIIIAALHLIWRSERRRRASGRAGGATDKNL
ncbi:DMT family transporter [Halodurantibacterium flavum]|uniref:DMT family transporter n=1 Tax=Halodurantibacterium flavum TaxID=1382802 RepID=A0ABW4S1M5_9RHOB